MSRITVYSTPDSLKAYLFVPDEYKDFYPDSDILKQTLYEQGIIYGVSEGTLAGMVSNNVCNKKVLVAEGKTPDPGIDGHLEILVDISGIGKPKELADGSVDHKELKKVINVIKGEKLMRRIPPVAGKDGYTVFGTRIPAPAPLDVVLKAGNGTEISGEDPDMLVSAKDGAVRIGSQGDMEVRTTKVITGDIDYSTGNISFSGDLKINGIVRSGFAVRAGGNLYIGDSVEDSEIVSSGNIEIIGGAVGSGNGKIICGGTLKVRHIENFTVKAGKSVQVSDAILHSSIKTEGYLEAKTVIGGEIESSQGITADTIGATAETRTVIKVGSTFILLQQKELFMDKFKELHNELQSNKERIYALVKDGMDEKGKLTKENEAELLLLKQKVRKIAVQVAELQDKLNELEKKLLEVPNPVVRAGNIFPNTIFRFGLSEKIIKEKLNNVLVHAHENKVIINRQ